MSGIGATGSPGPHLGDALSGLLDGELPPAAEAAARQHLAGCHDCAIEYQAVQKARTWVRNLPEVDPPFGFYERLLRPESPVLRPVPWLWQTRRRTGIAALGASAAAAVVLLGVASPSESPISPPVNQFVEAHATGASDPLSGLAPIVVPVSLQR